MSNEPTTAVTAESVSAANPTTAETTKTLAETPERSSWIKVISTSLLASLIVSLVILAHQNHGNQKPARLHRRPRGDRQPI